MLFTIAANSAENLIINYQPATPPEPNTNALESYPAALDTSALLSDSEPGGIGGSVYNPLADYLDITLPDSGLTLTFERAYDSINFMNSDYIHWSGHQFGSTDNYIYLLVRRKPEKPSEDKIFGILNNSGTKYNFVINSTGQQVVNLLGYTPLNCGLENQHVSELTSESENSIQDHGNQTDRQDTRNTTGGSSVIDVGTLYTSQVRAMFNSDADIEDDIRSAILIASMYFARTGINNVEYRFAGAQAIDPALGSACEANSGNCRIRDVGSNLAVTQFRESQNADLITIVQVGNVEFLGGDVMGISQTPGNNANTTPALCIDPNFDDNCYVNKIRYDSYDLFNYAHELGHNLGLFHDTLDMPQPNPIVTGARGYLDTTNNFATTMVATDSCENSSDPCTRLDRFSNPDPNFNNNGQPTGITGQADSFNGIQIAAPIVANYRNPPQEDAFEDDDVAADASNLNVTGNHTQEHNFIEDENNTQTFRPDWVRLFVPNTGMLTISASDKGPDAQPCFQLYEVNGSTQGGALTGQICTSGSIPNPILQFNNQQINSSYFLYIRNNNSVHDDSEYTLNVNFSSTPPPAGDAFEQDDISTQASVIHFNNENTDSGWLGHNFDDDSNDWISVTGLQSLSAVTNPSDTSQVFVVEFYLDSTSATTNHPIFCLADTQGIRTDGTVATLTGRTQCDNNDDEDDPFPTDQVAVGVVVRYPGTVPSANTDFEEVRIQVRFLNNQQFTEPGTDYQIRAIGRSCDTPCDYVWPGN